MYFIDLICLIEDYFIFGAIFFSDIQKTNDNLEIHLLFHLVIFNLFAK